jgi:heptosyltransferase-3
MVRNGFGGLLSADPSLHEVLESVKFRGTVLQILQGYARFVRRIRRARYDLVIDLRTGDRGAILAFLTGAQERVGRNGGQKQFWHDLLFTKVVRNPLVAPPPVHPGADQSLRIVREIGIETNDSMPRLFVDPLAHGRAMELLGACGLAPDVRWVTINPFSRWRYKEWDNGKWRQVIDRSWQKYGLPTVLIGSPEEAAQAAEIVEGREDRTFNLAGKTTLGELAAIISRSALHMGVDSAAPHIAAALGTPTVTIHGPSDWRSWRVADDLHRVVCPAMACAPCYRMGCEDAQRSRCLEELGAETVSVVVEEILEK